MPPINEAALDRYISNSLAPARKPIIEVQPTPTGYAVLKCGFAIHQFAGPSARSEAWEYAESILDDLKYEAEVA